MPLEVNADSQRFSRGGLRYPARSLHTFVDDGDPLTLNARVCGGVSGMCIQGDVARGKVLHLAAACATVLGAARRLCWVDGTEGFACGKPPRVHVNCANLQRWVFPSHFARCALITRMSVRI
jgi:hypothetical protein